VACEPQILFGEVGEFIVALPPGQPDGCRTHSLEQMAQRRGKSADALLALYRAAFSWCDGKQITQQPNANPPEQALAALWRLKFPGLSWEMFCDLHEECRHRNLNPWCDHVTCKIEHDPATKLPRVRLLVKINGLRALARSTKNYKGRKGPYWRGPGQKWIRHWDDEQPPSMARVGVYREGDVLPTWGTALWRSYAPATLVSGKPTLDPFWQQFGPHMLAKCAEADALRAAFAELAGLMTPDEMQQADAPKPDRNRAPRLTETIDDGPFDEDCPRNQRQFEQVLWRMGFRTADSKRQVMHRFCTMDDERWHDRNPAQFYRWAVRSIKAESEVYGLTTTGKENHVDGSYGKS
jgi:hypothetical protein